jgi:hypothetical protein
LSIFKFKFNSAFEDFSRWQICARDPSRPPAPPWLVVPTRHRCPYHDHPTQRALQCFLPWGCLL